MEIWKDIDGFDGNYQVSNLGRVRSVDRELKNRNGFKRLHKGVLLRSFPDKDGYLRVCISYGGKYNNRIVHRLVAKHFVDNPNEKPEVNHKNGIKTDNTPDNLEWVTSSENQIHSYRNKLQIHIGTETWCASKLKNVQVMEIKQRLKNGEKYNHIAGDYGVDKATIYDIWKGKTWKAINI